MFDGACLNTICALIFRGLQIQPPEALNLSCFVLSAPHWTRSELVAALERRSVVTPVRLEQIAGGEPHRWHLWVHSDVGLKLTLREVYAHCKGVSEQKDDAPYSIADFLSVDRPIFASTGIRNSSFARRPGSGSSRPNSALPLPPK